MTVSFVVYGKPQPAGSKRAFVKGGRAVVVDDAKGSRPWKQEITATAVEVMWDRALLDGPLSVTFRFYVSRPKGHMGAKGLRPSAPFWPTTRPDLLKLARAVEDALTGVVYRDDSQIVTELLTKHYDEPARVEVYIQTMDELVAEVAA